MSNVAPIYERTPYMRWIRNQGIPVHEGHGMHDLRDLETTHWERMGGKAAFIHLYGKALLLAISERFLRLER